MEIKGLDDPLETSVSVSTYDYYRPGILQSGASDPFLRASYDKKEKEFVMLQVYIRSNSSKWQRWNLVRYLDEGILRELPTYDIGTGDVLCSQYGCAHYEDVGFEVTEEQLIRWISAGKPLVIRIVSGSTTGVHHDMELPIDEMQAFLGALAQVRQ